MSDTLYLQLDKNIEVHRPQVYLQDIAQLSCSNSKVLSRCQVMPVIHLDKEQPGRYVFSVTDLVETILKKEENLDISPIGEPVFVITYVKEKKHCRLWHWLKTLFVCLTAFFGTAFSIMTFNNDVDVPKLFSQIYQQVTGMPSGGFTVLEISYSLGIGLGVLIFFNHFGKMKISQDPSPMQVQMRLYEDDVETTMIEQLARKEQR